MSKLKKGDGVTHPQFGNGFVEQRMGGMCKVVFDNDPLYKLINASELTFRDTNVPVGSEITFSGESRTDIISAIVTKNVRGKLYFIDPLDNQERWIAQNEIISFNPPAANVWVNHARFVLITWPASQYVMDQPWFEEEAQLADHPDSSYFIPEKRFNEYLKSIK